MEVSLIIEHISNALPRESQQRRPLEILEFGSGRGSQIPLLKTLGNVVASDIYTSNEIKAMNDTRFEECSIADTPFEDGQFDVIFSNHVIEHVENRPEAFRELKRIGKPSCIYAFSVPTNIWLLFSIPSQYYAKFGKLMTRVLPRKRVPGSAGAGAGSQSAPQRKHGAARLMQLMAPAGHGVDQNFAECYRNFKITSWEKFFRGYGFSIVKTIPLLLYGSSEWPIIPIMKNQKNLCSSVLFLLKKP